jgi:glycosyltransferase involved in cell wall biosynthesis
VSLEGLRDDVSGGWLFGYVQALQQAGIHTEIVCISARVDDPICWEHGPTGAPIWFLPASKGYKVLRRRLADPYAWEHRQALRDRRWRALPLGLMARQLAPYCATPIRTIAHHLRRQHYDAVLCQEYEYPRFDICSLMGLLLRLPTYATFQGGNFRLTPLEGVVRPLSLRLCSGVIIGSTTEATRMMRKYRMPAARVARIYNPLDIAAWPAERDPRIRSELDIPAEARVVAWHGRVDFHRKGLDVLCHAWHLLSSGWSGQPLRLLLVGTGNDAPELRRRIADLALPGVHWVDEYVLDRQLLRRYLSAADVYMFPSRNEGFPMAPVEAMACGLPVVSADVPGIRDIFVEGEGSGALIVPREDGPAVAAALTRVLHDETLRGQLGRRARRRAENAFGPEAVGRQLRAFLGVGGTRRRC